MSRLMPNVLLRSMRQSAVTVLQGMYAQMWQLRVAFGVPMLFTQSRRACLQA